MACKRVHETCQIVNAFQLAIASKNISLGPEIPELFPSSPTQDKRNDDAKKTRGITVSRFSSLQEIECSSVEAISRKQKDIIDALRYLLSSR